ncbi:hypothetical protein JXQ70_07310 [bacterium]|nr:hypothetical protein [bacterium]
MTSQIEELDRHRKRLLISIFIAFGLWYGLVLLRGVLGMDMLKPVGSIGLFGGWYGHMCIYVGLGAAGLCGFFLVSWGRYKLLLIKDRALNSAIEDERVKQAWLMAYRFSYRCLVGVLIGLFLIRASHGLIGSVRLAVIDSMGLHWLLYTAIMSCLGAFLVYNREGEA